MDAAGREAALKSAVGRNTVFRVTVRLVDGGTEWVPVAEFSLDRLDTNLDQEKLFFSPLGGRHFHPLGVIISIRRAVYPASVAARPHSEAERARRRSLSLSKRFALYLNGCRELNMRACSVGVGVSRTSAQHTPDSRFN